MHTVDGTERAGRIGADRPGGGREAVQERDEGVRGERARRPPDRVRPGPLRLVQGRAGAIPPGHARGAAGRTAGTAGNRRAGGMRGRLQVAVVRVPDVLALARLVLGVVQGSPESHVLRHGPRDAEGERRCARSRVASSLGRRQAGQFEWFVRGHTGRAELRIHQRLRGGQVEPGC